LGISSAGKVRTPRGTRIALAALACWAVGALIFAASPEDSAFRLTTAKAVYFTALAFALFCSARQAVMGAGGRERLLWGLITAGTLARLVGSLGRDRLQESAFAAQELAYQHVAYLASYLLFACALLLLVSSTARGITPITLLDSLSITLSVGVLLWYFFLGRMVPEAGSGLYWPLFDEALLFLCLVVFTAAGRPSFLGLLAAGFLAFVIADAWYLGLRIEGSYAIVGGSDLFRALGFVFVGSAALQATPITTPRQRIGSWRVFAFWLGPLSPPIQLAAVLAYGAAHPPLPAYVPTAAAVLLLYLGLRLALVSFASRRLNREQEQEIRKLEQGRVLYELHDTVKQSVHGISLALHAAMEAERRGEHDTARRRLIRALEASQEAEYHVSEPYDELQSVDEEAPSNPSDYLRLRLKKFEEYFGIETHEDFRIPFELLSPAEVAAAQRVFIEASWNAVKHSGARSLWLETRRVGSVVIVRTRDDGRGFDTSDPPPGLGLRYMRRRAGEVGAELDVISSPGRGTAIQLRFDKK
jgi:signal transduction histidine kinase